MANVKEQHDEPPNNKTVHSPNAQNSYFPVLSRPPTLWYSVPRPLQPGANADACDLSHSTPFYTPFHPEGWIRVSDKLRDS